MKYGLKIIEADELAHHTPLMYLKKINTTYKKQIKTRLFPGNRGGIQEDFEPTPMGVMWYFGKDDKTPRFISSEVCKKLPEMIREKEDLMKHIQKFMPRR